MIRLAAKKERRASAAEALADLSLADDSLLGTAEAGRDASSWARRNRPERCIADPTWSGGFASGLTWSAGRESMNTPGPGVDSR